MMKYPGKRKGGRFLGRFILLLLIIGYLLAAMIPVPEQPKVVREWSVSLAEEKTSGVAETTGGGNGDRNETEWIPFRTSKRFGYVSPQGEILFLETVLDGAAVSSTGFINYSRMGEALVMRVPREQYMYTITGGGLPFFRGGKLWLLENDATGIAAIGETGDRRFSLQFGTVITSLDAGGGITAAGLLDGTLHVFDTEGTLLWKQGSDDGENGVVYGVAVSPDGTRIAVVRGLDPQRVVLYSVAEGEMVKEYEGRFEQALRREVYTAFSAGGELLFAETSEGAWFRSLASQRERKIRTEGMITDYLLPSSQSPLFIGTAGQSGGTLSMLSVSDGLYARERYPSPVTMLYGDRDTVYVSTEEAIHKVRVTCE
jgi:hypothetical protein